MRSVPFGDGQPVIVDTSAWERSSAAPVAQRWATTLLAGAAAIATPVLLEILYTARSTEELIDLHETLSKLRQLTITRTVSESAVAAMVELGGRLASQPRVHRIPPVDYLTAAVAAEHGFGVLHYDPDFDRLAEVLAFESIWIAPPGSLD
jgi:predicted nucleic acid-binding protein